MAIEPKFHPLSVADGSWQALQTDWAVQCQAHGEDADTYAASAVTELGVLARDGAHKAAVFALKDGEKHVAICQANCTPLPGYDGPVLRIRFMTFCPDLDFGDRPLDDYAAALISMVLGALNLSNGDGVMHATHIKFHLRSPADRGFFAAFGAQLGTIPVFESVQTTGSWLYISKKDPLEVLAALPHTEENGT